MGGIYRRYRCVYCNKRPYKPIICCDKPVIPASSWIIDTTINGKRFTKAYPGVTKTEARQILKKLEGEAVAGEYDLFKEKKVLLKDYIESVWWPGYGENLKSSCNYRYNLDRHIIPEFGQKALHRITTKEIDEWRNRLKDQGLKPSTINRLVDLLRSIYTRANKWGDCRRHPVKDIKRLPECNERDYYLTPKQYQRLIGLVDEMNWTELSKVKMKAAITLAIQTCLRKENLFALRYDDIDFEKAQIMIPGVKTKNNEPIYLPLFSIVKETLEGLPKDIHSPYILTNVRGGRYKQFMKLHWQELRDKMAKIDSSFPADFHWHDLRTTGSSWLAMAGESETTRMQLMGLKSTRVLKRYTHLSMEHLREAGERIRDNFLIQEKERKKGEK